ncbi:DNA repair protein Rad50 [Thermococcus sp.]
MKVKPEEALREYQTLKRRREKELESLKGEYSDEMRRLVKEILQLLKELEEKEPPSKVDRRLLSMALRERKTYVTALRKFFSSLESIDDLGARLEKVSKYHVGHGRYLMILFEKDIYRVNKLLKELSELYGRYVSEISGKSLPELRIGEIMGEMEELKREISLTEGELNSLRKRLEELKNAPYEETDEIENERRRREELKVKIRTLRTELRSKASKLHKPLKRMRLPEAAPFLKDSSYALNNPDEFLNLVKRVYPKLDGKAKKASDWLLKNLSPKLDELRKLEEELELVEEHIKEAESASSDRRLEILRTEERVKRLENELHRQRSRLKSLEKRLKEEIRLLEGLLSES